MARNFIFVLLLAAAASPALAQRPDAVAFGNRIEMGDVAQARAWLRAGLHPDTLADRIGTGLMIAAWRGDMEMMALFVSSGADVNKTNAAGETALMHAAWQGQKQAVEWLLARGARIENGAGQWSALHYAAFSGHQEIAALLLARGADINARAPNGSSPLMMAVYEGHEEMVKQLVARGADASIRNDRGEGALEWAVKFGHRAIARHVGSASAIAAASARPPSPVVRSLPPPAQAPAAGQISELMRMRSTLAARGMSDSVERLDRRIASLRAQQAREQPRSGIVLEITARRAAPADQESRLLFSPPTGAR